MCSVSQGFYSSAHADEILARERLHREMEANGYTYDAHRDKWLSPEEVQAERVAYFEAREKRRQREKEEDDYLRRRYETAPTEQPGSPRSIR